MLIILLGLSAVSALAQPASKLFKLRSSNAVSMAEAQGTCQRVVDMIASFAPALGGTIPFSTPGNMLITFPKDKRTIRLTTQPKQDHCIATLTCGNTEGGGAEALCQDIERLVQDQRGKYGSQR
jgi:hypothetical protein